MPKTARPVHLYDFTAFSKRTPNQQPPGDRLDAQFREHANAIVEIQLQLADLDRKLAAQLTARPKEPTLANGMLGPNAGGPYAGDDAGATATSADYAQVSIDWAEHMPDVIPNQTLAVSAITGDHWSARWWANRAAAVSPAVAASLYYVSAANQTIFPLTTPDHFGKSYTLNQTKPESINVYVNGARLTPTNDFTVNVPTSTVTLTNPSALNAIVCFDILAPPSQLTPYVLPLSVAGDNRIINGDMRIDQRNNGASGTTAAVYTVDRWLFLATQTGKMNWGRELASQVSPAGFPYYLGFQTGTAVTLAANDSFSCTQKIEADMISDFAWGAPDAKGVTLSFWAFASVAGTYSGALTNEAATRSYPFSFALAADSPTFVTITVPGDTAGTWALSGNASSLRVVFDLGTGTTYRGPANAWASANYVGVTGAYSIAANAAAFFYITGVKLEIGSVATPFNRQSLAKSMTDCQRYYQGSLIYVAGYGSAGAAVVSPYFLPVAMRSSPTVAFTGASYSNASALVMNSASPTFFLGQITATATGEATASASAAFMAEL